MTAPRFDPIAYPASWPLAVCRVCACIIVDDDEGANRAQHAEWHERIEPTR